MKELNEVEFGLVSGTYGDNVFSNIAEVGA